MKPLLTSLLLLAMMVSPSFGEDAQKIINHLQDISVTIKAQSGGFFGGEAQGSGVLFTRKDGDDTTTYVWTAAHVVDGLKSHRPVLINGSPKIVTEFKDAQVVMEFQEDGRRVGETTVDARVIRYSDAETGRDLAILKIRKKNFAGEGRSTEFYANTVMPTVGTKLYHVGSLLGQFGSNSLTQGTISQTGRVLDIGASGTVFDQTSVTAFPGSSGGGVFLESNGQYVGMLVRGAGEQFNFIVPIREMREWAKNAKVEWAMDRNVPLPSEEDLKKLPIEDAGVTFEKDEARQLPSDEPDTVESRYEKVNKDFPFLIKIDEDGPC
jgi:S1-C subfamily serine protease